MAEDLIARYQLDISDLKLKVNQLETEYKKLTDAQKQSEKAGTDSAKKIGDETEKTGKKVNQTTKEVSYFEEQLKTIGNAIVGAFAVERIIAFGKESIKAFAEAEQNAKLLQTAVGVNGGLQDDFDNLINQSAQLQQTTIFSDDDIQRAQTAALQYGLTSDQVKELIPVLLDFASATGQDLNSALSAIISGTEGSERALRAFTIQVDSNIPKAENYAKIIEQLSRQFEGQAEIVAGTATGAIKQYDNQLGELAENLGSKIYPAYQTFATGILAFSRDLIDALSGNLGTGKTTLTETLARDAQIYGSIVKKESKEQLESQLKIITQTKNESEIKLKGLEKNTEEYNKYYEVVQRALQQEKIYSEEIKKRAAAQVEPIKVETFSYAELIKQRDILKVKQDFNSRSQLEQIEKEIKKRDELNKKSQEEINKRNELQKENLQKLFEFTESINQKTLESTAKTEIEKITIQRDAQIKQAEELFKDAGGAKNLEAVKAFNEARLAIENQYNGLIKEARLKSIEDTYDQQKKLNEDNSKEDLQNTLNNIEANSNQQILALKQIYLSKGDFSKEAEKKLQDDITKIQLDAEQKRVDEAYKFQQQKIENERVLAIQAAIQKAATEKGLFGLELLQNKELQDRIAGINALYNGKKLESDQQYANDLAKLGLKIVDGQIQIAGSGTKSWIENNQQKIQAAQQAASAIIETFNTILNTQIQNKEDELKLLQESYDAEDEELQFRLEKRLIGAGDFEKEQNRIKEQRIVSEKKIQTEIIKLKKQEDIANRAKALFEIAINTAVGISRLLGQPFASFLIPLTAVLGAAQVAAVLATPLPKYQKGTKYLERGKNPSGVDTIPIMANEGERIIPTQRNLKYWEVYNALDENRWNEFVENKYIYPALKNQISQHRLQENKTFAENISQSIMFDHDMLASKIGAEIEWRNRKGIKVHGMKELIEVMENQPDPRKA